MTYERYRTSTTSNIKRFKGYYVLTTEKCSIDSILNLYHTTNCSSIWIDSYILCDSIIFRIKCYCLNILFTFCIAERSIIDSVRFFSDIESTVDSVCISRSQVLKIYLIYKVN